MGDLPTSGMLASKRPQRKAALFGIPRVPYSPIITHNSHFYTHNTQRSCVKACTACNSLMAPRTCFSDALGYTHCKKEKVFGIQREHAWGGGREGERERERAITCPRRFKVQSGRFPRQIYKMGLLGRRVEHNYYMHVHRESRSKKAVLYWECSYTTHYIQHTLLKAHTMMVHSCTKCTRLCSIYTQ